MFSFDKLKFSHDISFGGRLKLDYPTISLTDLLSEKLQIHDITRKDLIDMLILLLGHEISNKSSRETIDGYYIARILSDDWGFWYDATRNLTHLKSFAEELVKRGRISKELSNMVVSQVDKLLGIIDSHEKTKSWYKRAEIGTKRP